MSVDDIGVNYAAAFIDSLKAPEEIQKASRDLDTFAALLDELPALARVLEHPGMPLSRRVEILDEALAQIEAHPVSRRLLRLVVEKGRVRHVKEIAARFGELRDARLNVASAVVVTAVPLEGPGRAEWERTLARLTGKKVTIAYRTDPELIGGAVARIGSTVYDGSVKRQLERIRTALLSDQRDKMETRS